MADTEDVAKVLYEYVTGEKYDANAHIDIPARADKILDRLDNIVIEWYIDILDARNFVKRMKSIEECEKE